ncbi:MAG: methyl-accepting chemotaxis protein [Pseudooceanicola sp.]
MNASQVPAAPGRSRLPSLANLKLVIKLPLLIIAPALIVSVALAVTAYTQARTILEAQIESRFSSTLDDRAGEVARMFEEIASHLTVEAANPTVQAGTAAFGMSWSAMGETPADSLRDLYIAQNEHPAGARDRLVTRGGADQYDFVHAKYHPYFRNIMKTRGISNIFLIDGDGNVTYSVRKDEDFATNIAGGEWRDTGLAKAWRAAADIGSGEVVFEDFTAYAPREGIPAAFLASPLISRSGNRLGTLVFQVPVDGVARSVGVQDGLGDSGRFIVVGDDRRVRAVSETVSGLAALDPAPELVTVEMAFDGRDHEFVRQEGEDGIERLAMAAKADVLGRTWIVAIDQTVDEMMAPVQTLLQRLVLVSAVLAAAIALVGILFARTVARPFAGVGRTLEKISGGQYDLRVPYLQRGDDIGELARNLDRLRGELAEAERAKAERERQAADQRHVVEHLSAAISKLADGDLTGRIATQFAPEYETLRNGLNGALDRLGETVASLMGATHEIDANARDVEGASNELSQKAIEQAASLEETAAAITELSASVKSTADSAGEADKVMSRAKSDAEASGQEVNRAMTAMDRIAASSQKITQVTSVIEDLAFQTNLLALNAGVEAARAGEAGRGFAVVASEVRALAQRSSDAAKEINGLIQESADNVTNGVSLVEKAGKSFENMIGDFDKVSKSVSVIAAAAREQATGLSEINSAVDQLDGVTQKNAAVAANVHGTGKVMVSEADKLNRIAARFTIGDKAGKKEENPPAASRAEAPTPPRVAPAKRAVNAGAPVMGVNDEVDDVWAEF